MVHDITVCFAGLYCGLFLYLVEVKKRAGGTFESLVGLMSQRTRRFSARKKGVVSAVIEANNRGVCSSLPDLHKAHHDGFFFTVVGH